MPISAHLVNEHVERWVKKLSESRAPYRNFWPSYLFRHEELHNAVNVIKSGNLMSRNAARDLGFNDIAAPGVIETNLEAHNYSRLYFRPRTPTQFHVEGIRRDGDFYQNNPSTHAPVLVMFVFSASKVLTRDGTKFSKCNMQSPYAESGDDDVFFQEINFDNVYHTFPVNDENRYAVTRERCAEVMAISPLSLVDNLEAILCRSSAERSFLLYEIGPELSKFWSNKVYVHSQTGIFERTWAFVDTVDAHSDGFEVKFHSRSDGKPCNIEVKIYHNNEVVYEGKASEADLSKKWRAPYQMGAGLYGFEIILDDIQAYRADHVLDDSPF